MSNYVKSTNFYAKDALVSGNPDKIIKGAEIDDEFNNIATAVATKSDLNSPTFTGIPSGPTATAGSSTTQLATTAFVSNISSTLGTLSTQNANAVAITGGTIAGATGTTATTGTSNLQLATNAYVEQEITNIPYATGSVKGMLRAAVTPGTGTSAGSFVVGTYYTITAVGTTSFTAIGALSNTVGVSFIATAVGSGTGTATTMNTLNLYTTA
jgi:hypothetical protein